MVDDQGSSVVDDHSMWIVGIFQQPGFRFWAHDLQYADVLSW